MSQQTIIIPPGPAGTQASEVASVLSKQLEGVGTLPEITQQEDSHLAASGLSFQDNSNKI